MNLPALTAFGLAYCVAAPLAHADGWNLEQLIELANGQVWRIADGSRAFFDATNPKVRIERGSFSTFYMVITGTNQAPRVRRVK